MTQDGVRAQDGARTQDGALPGALVIGARGALGSLLVEAFGRAGWAVTAGVRRPDHDTRVRQVALDLADPDTVAAALPGADVVVNLVPDAGLVAERMVLARGGALVNLSAMPADAGRLLRAEAGEARGAVLMNAGVAPGITNLVVADLLATNPEADEVEMVFTIATNSTAGPAAADFAHRGLTARSRHRTVRVPLPAPFGTRRALGFAEPDGGWLGDTAAGRTVRTYVCFAEPAAHAAMLALNAGHMLSRLPRAALRSRTLPEASREPVAHWVALRRRGERIAARTLEGRGDFRMAAEAGVLFADALLGRDHAAPAAPGVWNPEDIRSIAELDAALRAAGLAVQEQPIASIHTAVPSSTARG